MFWTTARLEVGLEIYFAILRFSDVRIGAYDRPSSRTVKVGGVAERWK